MSTVSKEDEETYVLLNIGLLARIEALKSENRELKAKLLQTTNASSFIAINFAGSDKLIRLYTGFPSYEAFLSFLSSWDLLRMNEILRRERL